MPSDFSFLPALPEIIMAVGALALLMLGVFGGNRVVTLVTYLAVILLALVLLVVALLPADGVTFNGAFVLDPFARLMKILVLIGSGVAIVMSVGFARAAEVRAFRVPGAHRHRHARHDADDLGQ